MHPAASRRRGQLNRPGHLRIWTAPTNPVPVSSARLTCTAQAQAQPRQPSLSSSSKDAGINVHQSPCMWMWSWSLAVSQKPAIVAGEYAHIIEGSSSSSSLALRLREICKGMQCRCRHQCSQRAHADLQRGRPLAACALRCDSHYTNRHKGLRRRKQGV